MSIPTLFNLNSIRNCSKPSLLLPYSSVVYSCLGVIFEAGYISSFEEKIINDWRYIEVYIKYDSVTKKNLIYDINFISKPSRRIYSSFSDLRKMYSLNKSRLILVSTSLSEKISGKNGIMSISDAVKYKTGGEILCEIVL
jgi:ribosomal protein S8